MLVSLAEAVDRSASAAENLATSEPNDRNLDYVKSRAGRNNERKKPSKAGAGATIDSGGGVLDHIPNPSELFKNLEVLEEPVWMATAKN